MGKIEICSKVKCLCQCAQAHMFPERVLDVPVNIW